MIIVRPAKSRGVTHIDWLKSYHSFSFGSYRNPENMGVGPLRVINEDFVKEGGGFETHGHKDMEIITYVLSGALAHRDSMGNGTTIHAGEVQKMSAGSGVEHSEFNASDSEPVHFLQIWIKPDQRGIAPNYGQIKADRTPNRLITLASNENKPGQIHVQQDIALSLANLESGNSLNQPLSENRIYYLQVIRGSIGLNGESLQPGDGAEIIGESQADIKADETAEFLLFDLPR